MNPIKQSSVEALKRVNLNIPTELHNQFKAAAATRGESMTDVLLKTIQQYVEKYGPAPAKKGRRA